MYGTTQNYLYIKKRTLCKRKNKNTLANPTRILNLQGIATLQLNNPITCPTNIDQTILDTEPFYEAYTIDPSGALFGEASYPCSANTLEKNVFYSNCNN